MRSEELLCRLCRYLNFTLHSSLSTLNSYVHGGASCALCNTDKYKVHKLEAVTIDFICEK